MKKSLVSYITEIHALIRDGKEVQAKALAEKAKRDYPKCRALKDI